MTSSFCPFSPHLPSAGLQTCITLPCLGCAADGTQGILGRRKLCFYYSFLFLFLGVWSCM